MIQRAYKYTKLLCLSVQISNFNKVSKTKRGQHAVSNLLTSFGRDYWTRTSDPYVPNVVRYQLRYIPFLFCECKGKAFF